VHDDGGPVDFARDVQPIFQSRCYECHSARRQKGELRLDARAFALAPRAESGGPILVPGRSAESRLFRLITLPDPAERMPRSGDALSAEQIDVLRRWIDQGAGWPAGIDRPVAAAPPHWAYQSVAAPALPEVRDPGWVRNPIDAFVLERLEREGLAPAPQAERATLLRRASLDLTGLPPTLEELDLYLADDSPGAYERAVERMLASPHYGERMAQRWLDLARYADSHGYEKDSARSMWPWRDWVIDAYQRDLPFDRFTIEQLAGDLLPDASLAQRVATGFHRNTLVNEEGGIDPEEFRAAALIDRVNTTGFVWLGSTVMCAQCHDHKYDPFTQREYYELLAFFDSTKDTGNVAEPLLAVPSAEQAAELARLDADIESAARLLEAPDEALDVEAARWSEGTTARIALDEARWRTLVALEASAASGAVLELQTDGSILASGTTPDIEVYTVVGSALEGTLDALRLEALEDPSLPAAGPGRAGNGNFVLSELALELLPAGASARARRLALVDARADYEQEGARYAAALALDADATSGWAVDRGLRPARRVLVVALAEPLALARGDLLRVTLRHESPHAQHVLGRFRLAVGAGPDRELLLLPSDVIAVLSTSAAQRDEARRSRLRGHWRGTIWPGGRGQAEALAAARERRAALEREIPTTLVMEELAEPRTTHVYVRGSFLAPGERVEPGVPAWLGALPAEAPRDRLGLARWLVNGANPLTARVAVNRLWEQCFGTGLVPTSEDFGTRGDPPSHPGLLDWLAREFVEGGWSTRAVLRTIVTSSTYRQNSHVTSELWELDPEDRLLARAPRLRLEAETLRDLALAASELLAPRIGGPSVFPPQPPGIWNAAYDGQDWQNDTGAGRWRRGLYTFWRRSAPYATFTLFDAPSRELACTRRLRSNTPLQALAVLNDPAFVEAAGGLARRMIQAASGDDVRGITLGFRSCVARTPEEAEVVILRGLLDGERARYGAAPERAAELAGSAAVARSDVPDDPVELASWICVANALLNLDETLTRD
jgi:hypothetical protein